MPLQLHVLPRTDGRESRIAWGGLSQRNRPTTSEYPQNKTDAHSQQGLKTKGEGRHRYAGLVTRPQTNGSRC